MHVLDRVRRQLTEDELKKRLEVHRFQLIDALAAELRDQVVGEKIVVIEASRLLQMRRSAPCTFSPAGQGVFRQGIQRGSLFLSSPLDERVGQPLSLALRAYAALGPNLGALHWLAGAVIPIHDLPFLLKVLDLGTLVISRAPLLPFRGASAVVWL